MRRSAGLASAGWLVSGEAAAVCIVVVA
jgi:hypothetical protein